MGVGNQRHAPSDLLVRNRPVTHSAGGWVANPKTGLGGWTKSRSYRDSTPGSSNSKQRNLFCFCCSNAVFQQLKKKNFGSIIHYVSTNYPQKQNSQGYEPLQQNTVILRQDVPVVFAKLVIWCTIWYNMTWYDMIWYVTIWYDIYLLQLGFQPVS